MQRNPSSPDDFHENHPFREPKTSPVLTYGFPRDFLGNKHVYVVMSSRAKGLTVGVNLNPDNRCNFDCVYCEIDRRSSDQSENKVDAELVKHELVRTLTALKSGQLRERPYYSHLPLDLLSLRHVALSGHGEPTLCKEFDKVVESVSHVRAQGHFPFFKLVLFTNGSVLDDPLVQKGLKMLTTKDEIWAKLDAGTEAYMKKVNKTEVSIAKILSNISMVGKQRPIIIQSLFPLYNNEEPPMAEIMEYSMRLRELKHSGVNIPLVQIYSANRPMVSSGCGHLRLKTLSQIAKIVRAETGLIVELF
jgi:wyosine [tRNA(Phe)-imidazoG37] synthetase (radical SAM superfamily)